MHAISQRLTIVCLPYAGGGCAVFHGWRDALRAVGDVFVPPLPGRDTLVRRAPLTRMEPMIQHLRDLLAARPIGPWMLFGHSMGALIAFELAREFVRRGETAPVHLIVSAHAAPDHKPSRPPLHDLPEQELINELRSLEGTPEEFFASSELRELLLPRLRADFELCETYRYAPSPRLSIPITVLGGEEDGEVSASELDRWSSHTDAEFASVMLPGNHFFIGSSRCRVLQIVRDIAVRQFVEFFGSMNSSGSEK